MSGQQFLEQQSPSLSQLVPRSWQAKRLYGVYGRGVTCSFGPMMESEVWRIERVEGFGGGAAGWTTAASVTGVRLDPNGSSAARVINNAMASVHAAVAKTFATVVRLNIVIVPSQKGVDLRM
jgi:hypothetical protein